MDMKRSIGKEKKRIVVSLDIARGIAIVPNNCKLLCMK